MQNVLRTCALFLLCIGLCLCLGITAFADGEQVIIPSGVTRLEAEAFANCEAMTDVVIPERVTAIGDGCFSGCTNLADVYYSGTLEQWGRIGIGADNEALANARRIFLGGHPASESVTINGKAYMAHFCGRVENCWAAHVAYQDFWVLDNAYEDFRAASRSGDNLPDVSFPIPISSGQVYIVDCTRKDGRAYRQVMRCDGNIDAATGWVVTHSILVDTAPLYSETKRVNGKAYTASYLGSQNISSWSEKCKTRDFWRLENAYDDFKDLHRISDNLPEDNYPVAIAAGQVFVIDYTLKSGGVYREVMRCDGNTWEGMLNTHALAVVDIPPIRTDILTVNGKQYTASYFGSQKRPDSDEKYSSREFWRLENAYDDFKNTRYWSNHYTPESRYPMGIQAGQIFAVDYTLRSGGTERMIMRCDGNTTDDGYLNTIRLVVDIPPIRTDTLTVNGKPYTASYYGSQTLPDSSEKYSSREFWRLENAYQDFKDCPFANDNLPESNYPMDIHPGQVFVIDYTLRSGGVFRELMRCDGNTWEGMLTTHAFTVD